MALPQRDSNGRFIKSTDTKDKKSFMTKAQLQKAWMDSIIDIKNLKQEIFDKDTLIRNIKEKLYTSNVINFVMTAVIVALLIAAFTIRFY